MLLGGTGALVWGWGGVYCGWIIHKQSHEILERKAEKCVRYPVRATGSLDWSDFWNYGGRMICKRFYKMSKRKPTEYVCYSDVKSVGSTLCNALCVFVHNHVVSWSSS